MTKELLLKYFNNNCTQEELAEVIRWFEQEANSVERKKMMFADWNSIETDNNDIHEEKLNILLDRIHHKINLNETKSSRKKTLRTITTWFTRAAAILLIPVLVYLFYTESFLSMNKELYAKVDTLEFTAPSGSRAFIQLPDGTEVHLDFGSSIKYPRIFQGNTRELILSGEGFFHVAHNPQKPFIVKTKYMDVKVLGTKFNVVSYPEKEFVTTTLVEGKVALQRTNEQGNVTTLSTMTPGQHVRYDGETGKISSEIGDVRKYIAWKDGILMFDNTNITDIAEKLGRMFNVEFEIADDIKDYTYTVTFIDEQLVQILDYMTMATPITYKKIPRQQLPDGTLCKQKIILEKDKKPNTKQRK